MAETLGLMLRAIIIPFMSDESLIRKEGLTKEELMIYHQKVCRQINLLQEAFAERNLEKARKIMASERKYLDLEAQYRVKHLERIRA